MRKHKLKITQGILIALVAILGVGATALAGKALDDKYGWVEKAKDRFAKPVVPDEDDDDLADYYGVKIANHHGDTENGSTYYNFNDTDENADIMATSLTYYSKMDTFVKYECTNEYSVIYFSEVHDGDFVFLIVLVDDELTETIPFEDFELGYLYDFSNFQTKLIDDDLVADPIITKLK